VSANDAAGDAEIRALVKRLARPCSSGGHVIERAALLASGNDFAAVMAWIADHDGVAEMVVSKAPQGGLHGSRPGLSGGAQPQTPLRFVLPAGALT
jgi:hypothetical protein